MSILGIMRVVNERGVIDEALVLKKNDKDPEGSYPLTDMC